EWGEQVFGSLFGGGAARFAYERARDRGLELVFRSPEPGLLGLPWELMRGPHGPVALRLAGGSRALPVADLAGTAAGGGGGWRGCALGPSRRGGRGGCGVSGGGRPVGGAAGRGRGPGGSGRAAPADTASAARRAGGGGGGGAAVSGGAFRRARDAPGAA